MHCALVNETECWYVQSNVCCRQTQNSLDTQKVLNQEYQPNESAGEHLCSALPHAVMPLSRQISFLDAEAVGGEGSGGALGTPAVLLQWNCQPNLGQPVSEGMLEN